MADLFAVLDGTAAAVPFVVVQLPGAPRGKQAPQSRWVPPNPAKGRMHGFVHHYTPKETEVYQANLAKAARAAMVGKNLLPAGTPVALRVFAMMPIPKSWSRRDRDAALAGTKFPTTKPDDDNIRKCLDAFNWIIFEDDAQVCRTLIVKEYAEHPGLIVEVYLLP